MMDTLIQAFPAQLDEALQLSLQGSGRAGTYQNILIAGMGGSGIGADFVQTFVREHCSLPIQIVKGYALPSGVGAQTLVIASSYSGNTEETLAIVEQTQALGAELVVVSSGGKLLALAEEQQLDRVQVPGGIPSPRACLGYSIVAQLMVLVAKNLAPAELLDQVRGAAALLHEEQDRIRERARHLALALGDKMPVLYSSPALSPVALRCRQQLNENAKMLCWHHEFPEMNHNELVGWRGEQPHLAALLLRQREEHPRVQARLDICKAIFDQYAGASIEVYARGNNLVERSFYLVHLADWASLELATLRQVDPNEIRVIDFLKQALKEV
jgi:glucose/mannose-6-phosphate isomerase